MSPAKDEGSSAIRGKKLLLMILLPKLWTNKLLSSNWTTSRRGKGLDPNSDCHPLINPWHDAHIHFPMVPSDYSPSPPSHVWLSICRYDTKVSWALLASTIPDLDVRQGISLLVPILFEFGSGPSLGWKEWVDKELPDVGFMAAL